MKQTSFIEIRHTGIDDSAASQQQYDAIYQNRPIQHRDSFYLWLLGLLNPRRGERLLDVSCGRGRLGDLAARFGVEAHGVDFSFEAVRAARDSSTNQRAIVSDAMALPYAADAFDFVTNVGSIEHYESPLAGLREMARVLRPSGRALILVPSAFHYLHVWFVWRNGHVFDDGQPIQRYGTSADWQELLVEAGFIVERVVGYDQEPPQTIRDALWYFRRPGKLLRALITPLLPVDAANCIVFLCRSRANEA